MTHSNGKRSLAVNTDDYAVIQSIAAEMTARSGGGHRYTNAQVVDKLISLYFNEELSPLELFEEESVDERYGHHSDPEEEHVPGPIKLSKPVILQEPQSTLDTPGLSGPLNEPHKSILQRWTNRK